MLHCEVSLLIDLEVYPFTVISIMVAICYGNGGFLLCFLLSLSFFFHFECVHIQNPKIDRVVFSLAFHHLFSVEEYQVNRLNHYMAGATLLSSQHCVSYLTSLIV